MIGKNCLSIEKGLEIPCDLQNYLWKVKSLILKLSKLRKWLFKWLDHFNWRKVRFWTNCLFYAMTFQFLHVSNDFLLVICTWPVYVCVLVAQLCPTLCDPIDYIPPGSSVHGILQARILEWVPFPSLRDLPDPGIKPGSPTLQADSLPSEPPRKPAHGLGVL